SRRGPRLLRLPVLYRLSTVAAGAHVLRLGGGDLDGPARSVPDRRAGLAARPVRLEPEAVAAGAASAVDAGAIFRRARAAARPAGGRRVLPRGAGAVEPRPPPGSPRRNRAGALHVQAADGLSAGAVPAAVGADRATLALYRLVCERLRRADGRVVRGRTGLVRRLAGANP